MTHAGYDIVRALADQGVTVWAEDDRLKFRSASPLTPEQTDRLRKYRDAILEHLRQPAVRLGRLIEAALPGDPDGQQAMRDRFEELAGTYQFDGGLSRAEAEEEAADTVERMLPAESE